MRSGIWKAAPEKSCFVCALLLTIGLRQKGNLLPLFLQMALLAGGKVDKRSCAMQDVRTAEFWVLDGIVFCSNGLLSQANPFLLLALALRLVLDCNGYVRLHFMGDGVNGNLKIGINTEYKDWFMPANVTRLSAVREFIVLQPHSLAEAK